MVITSNNDLFFGLSCQLLDMDDFLLMKKASAFDIWLLGGLVFMY